MVELLVLVVVVALVFDFINGFHDAANAIATSVATGVMPVKVAVVVSGILNLIGALCGTAVASFITTGLVADPSMVGPSVVLAALIGASAWNLITWWYGIPSSSSHALIGGLAGAVVAHHGIAGFMWSGLVTKVLLPLVCSPLIGFILAFTIMIALLWICRRFRPERINRVSRSMQFLSACNLSFAHGLNDAQKVMGVITLALVGYMGSLDCKPPIVPDKGQTQAQIVQWVETANAQAAREGRKPVIDPARLAGKPDETSKLPTWFKTNQDWLLPHTQIQADPAKPGQLKEKSTIPRWVILACAMAMCLGTIVGGKRIIKTMSSKIIRLVPLQGFAAEMGSSTVIMTASHYGLPISTTHCITSCIMGVGSTHHVRMVRWNTVFSILTAWILTPPAGAIMAWLAMKILTLCGTRA